MRTSHLQFRRAVWFSVLPDPVLKYYRQKCKRIHCGFFWVDWFNILVLAEVEVRKDSIGYLPTIDAPATSLSTVFEVLNQSFQVKGTLKLQTIVVVFDEAL